MAGLDDYISTVNQMYVQPTLEFLQPVTNFLTSGSRGTYDPDNSYLQNITAASATPVGLFDDNWMSKDMDLTFGVGDVPVASDYMTTINDVHSPNVIDYASGDPFPDITTPIDYASGDPWHTMESTTTPKTDAEIAEIYRQQRVKAGRSRLGVTNEEWKAANPTDDSGRLNITLGGGGGGGSGGGGSVPSAPVLNTRMPLNRIPSGSVYAPDLSAYNDSSLFNYTGPGGASEYTYGQNLPYQGAGYNIWGSPTNVANPYFWGQFANTAETGAATGPADAAINMPSVEMPAGVPSTNTTTPSGTFDPYKGEAVLNQNVTKTTFPSPPGANPTLADRQRAQMGAEKWDAMVAQANAMDRQLRESQLGNVPQSNYGMEWFEDTNNPNYYDEYGNPSSLYGSDTYSPLAGGETEARMNFLNLFPTISSEYDLGRPGDPSYEEFVANPSLFTSYVNPNEETLDAGVVPYVGDAGRGTIVEQPGDRYNAMNPGIDAAMLKYNRDNPTPENFWSTRTQEERDALEARAENAITAEDLRDGLFGDPTYSIANDAFTLNMLPQKNNANVDSEGNLINRTPPERDFFKEDERDIPTPFKPEGVEGEDYWQSTQGGYYKMADDMGLEPILPPPPLPRIEPFHPPRNSTTTLGRYTPDLTSGTGRTAYESPGSRKAYADFMNLPDDSYAKELHLGQIEGESTSNLTAIELADSIEAIDKKYEGSTTDASAEAELGEIIGAIQLQFSEPMDLDEYNELSTRDLIKPSLTYLEDRAGSHSASSDLYAQNERQQHGRVQPVVNSGPPRRQAIPRIPEPSIFDRVADSFSRNFSLFGGR